MTIIWCRGFFYVWFLRYQVADRIFCHFGPFFVYLPPKNPKNQNFEKMNKMPEDITILNKCTKNHDHMLYCSWDMVCDGCNCYFSFWTIFALLPPNSPKNQKFQKNEKKAWRSHHFTQVYQELWLQGILFLR